MALIKRVAFFATLFTYQTQLNLLLVSVTVGF